MIEVRVSTHCSGNNNTGMSTKVDCKYDDGKRVKSDFGDSKEELFGYQTDNFDDLTDDDDEVAYFCL